MTEKYLYRNPISVRFEENTSLPDHYQMELFLEGRNAGFARLEKKEDGSYYVSIAVRPEFRSGNDAKYSRLGSDLLESVNEFLKSKNAHGFLNETMDDTSKSGMYARHGWVLVKDNLYTFDGTQQ